MSSRACKFQIIKSDQIFTIVVLQFKTGVKSTLTSQIKELGTINTFCIKNWEKKKCEPGRIEAIHDDKHLNDVDGNADVLELLDEERGAWLGATTERKLFFHKN